MNTYIIIRNIALSADERWSEMDKLEKVIRGLECCANPDMSMCLDECPYHTDGCSGGVKMIRDALTLLKVQEPQYVYDCAEMIDDIVVGKCPSCDRTIVNKINDPTRFCKYCGQAVKWE